MTIPIIYQDESLLLVNKPAGLLVHRSEIDRHETDFLLQRVRDQVGRQVFAVNRLDKPTSGLVLLALDRTLVAPCVAALQADTSLKVYLAVVRGVLPDKGVIDKPLKRIRDDHDRRTGPAAAEEQSATTAYQRLAQCELPFAVDKYPSSRYSLARLTLMTGRRHQLRRHMKSLAHPIIGDTSYGKGRHNRFFASQFECPRLLLHAWQVQFRHPLSAQMLKITAPLDENFQNLIRQLDWTSALEAGPGS